MIGAMTKIAHVWSRVARGRQARANRHGGFRTRETEEAWLRDVVKGKSFAEIGGLLFKEGHIAFLAEESGATQVTELDVGDFEKSGFSVKHRERNSKIRYVQGNLEDPESIEDVGVHDVVWCTGVLYHTPHPMTQLLHLRRMTRELLLLGTATIPEIPGFPQACVYYPYLEEADRQPFALGYGEDRAGKMLAINAPVDERPMEGYGNCYWGMTPSALRAMLRTARFEVLEQRRMYNSPFTTRIVARPIPADPLLPPVGYFRARGRALAEGRRPPLLQDYHDTSG